MNNLLRGLIAGYGAKKLGGGCLGTVLVFIIIWVALGQCSCSALTAEQEEQAVSYNIHCTTDAQAGVSFDPLIKIGLKRD